MNSFYYPTLEKEDLLGAWGEKSKTLFYWAFGWHNVNETGVLFQFGKDYTATEWK